MAWTERFVDASASGGGTGTSASDPWTLAEAWNNSTGGMKVNIKAGTYTINTVLDRNLGGTSSNQVWWSGYKTTPGDLDELWLDQKTEGTDFPKINLTANYWIERGGHWWVSSLSCETTSNSRPALWPSNGDAFIWNCKLKRSGSTTGRVLELGQRCNVLNTTIEYAGNSYTTGFAQINLNTNYINCVFIGDPTFSNAIAGSQWYGAVYGCIFKNLDNAMEFSTNGTPFIANNTFLDITDSAIRTTAAIGTNAVDAVILNNYFSNCDKAINLVSVTGDTVIVGNTYESVTTELTNVYQDEQFNSQNDSSDQFVDSANDDYTLKTTSNAYAAAVPNFVQQFGLMSKRDIGAIQHVPIADSSQPQQAGTQVMPFGQWAITNPEAALHPLRSS